MNNNSFKRIVAEYGYNMYYTVNKNFSTYDIVDKIPSYFGVITFSVGVVQIRFPDWKYNIDISTALIIVGIALIYLNFYSSSKDEYNKNGEKQTELFNRLQAIYFEIDDSNDVGALRIEVDGIMSRFYEINTSRQVFLSDWYSHYKMFVKKKTSSEWFENELGLTWKDKVPLTALCFLILLVICMGVFLYRNFGGLLWG